MKPDKNPLSVIALLLAGMLIMTLPQVIHAFQDSQALTPGEEKSEEQAEEIHPGPQNSKEKIAIYVFIAWLWISIVILVIFLRLRIKEADRLHQLDYFFSPRGKKFLKTK